MPATKRKTLVIAIEPAHQVPWVNEMDGPIGIELNTFLDGRLHIIYHIYCKLGTY